MSEPSTPTTSTAPPGYCQILGSEMVTVEIGPSKSAVLIHKGILCKKSEYFHNMFNSGFSETITQSAHLEEVEPFIFSLFVEWVYGDNIQSLRLKRNDPETGASVAELIKLYVFGEMIVSPELQDCVARAIVRILRDDVTDGNLRLEDAVSIYETIPPGPSMPLRKLAAESVLWVLVEKEDLGSDQAWSTKSIVQAMQNPEISLDVLAKLRRQYTGECWHVTPQAPWISANCRYHKHGEDEDCNYPFSGL